MIQKVQGLIKSCKPQTSEFAQVWGLFWVFFGGGGCLFVCGFGWVFFVCLGFFLIFTTALLQ